MQRFASPSAAELVARARQAALDAPEESRDTLARVELALIRDEATRLLALATLLPRGMARIALSSGTAFAVVALTRYSSEGTVQATIGACAAFAGGVCGSALSAAFGRRARDLTTTARHDWKRALRDAEAELTEADRTK
jgi:hypothetical protein